MTSRVYSTWNPNVLGEGLALDQGNLVVTTLADALSNSRKVLGTLPKAGQIGFFETEFYSTPRVSLGTNAAVGLAEQISALDAALGVDANSIGYYPATGDILYNNIVVGTLNPIDERTTIGTYMNTFGGHQYLNVIISGAAQIQLQLDDGKFWVPALTLGGGNAGETSAFTNFGQRGFNYPRIIAVPS